MTPRTWAEEKVVKAATGYQWNARIRKSTVRLQAIAAKLLLAEHQRAVRICKRYMKSYNYFLELTDDEVLKARWRTRIGVCVDLLAALERGRTGRGK